MSKVKEDKAIRYKKGVSVNTSPEEDMEKYHRIHFCNKKTLGVHYSV